MASEELERELRQLEELAALQGGGVPEAAPTEAAAEIPSQYQSEIDAILAEAGGDEGRLSQFGRGTLAGLKGTGRSAANLLLPESLEPEWATKEAVRKQKEIDDATLEGWGTAGKFAGEMLATAPLGGVGWGARGLKAASMASKYLPKTAAALGKSINPATIAATEGAGAGALMADPEHRGAGAIAGGLAGPALVGAGKLVGKVLPGGAGAVPISKAAREVEKEIQHTLPLSMAAGTKEGGGGIAQSTYKEILPMFPIARKALERQTNESVVKMNEAMIRKAYGSTLKGGGIADDMLKKIDEGMSFRQAIQHGNHELTMLRKPGENLPYAQFSKMREAITKASQKADEAGFNPLTVSKQMRSLNPETTPAGLKGLEQMEELMKKAGAESSAFGRKVFYGAGDYGTEEGLQGMLKTAMGHVATLGLFGAPRFMASPKFQHILRQDKGLRDRLAKATNEGTKEAFREFISAARRTVSGKAAPLPEENANAP